MAIENNIATQLNDLLVTQDFHPELLDKTGRPCSADDAKTFSFDYVSKSGKNYGTMVIVLGNDNEMQVMYGDNLGRTMEGSDKEDFFNFTQMLHQFAVRNFWNYTPQDLSKLKHVQAGIAAIQEGLFEGYYGNRKVSYAGEATEARLMIKHKTPLGENDARFRNVETIFIETADSERFKLPFTNLSGARAMLEHVTQGGKPYDIRGNHICEMVTELKVLNRFNRASKGRVSDGVTKELVEGAQVYYQSLREGLKHLGTSRGYKNYFETWSPLEVTEQDKLVEDIKTLFVEQTIDTRIEAALPLLARIQQGNAMKEAQIFESWINNLAEGTWELPETPEQQDELKMLMSQPLIAGADGIDATEQLYNLVGDDVLFDAIEELAANNPDANIWEDDAVQRRLEELGIYMVEPTEGEEVAPVPDTQDTGVPDGGKIAPAAPVAPVAEALNAMRRAAGLAESILDESGETLDHILNRFKFEVKQFEANGDLDHDLYEALYDYYMDKGEIPYGVAKGRTGDPYEWISDKFAQDVGVNEADNMASFVEAPLDEFIGMPAIGEGPAVDAYMSGKSPALAHFADQLDHEVHEGSCNSTMEGEYCPEHGLAECGTSAGGMAPVMGEEQLAEFDIDTLNQLASHPMAGPLAAAGGAAIGATVGKGIQKAADWYKNRQEKKAMNQQQGVAETDDAINYNGAVTGSYYESKEGDAMLARIKSLALIK